jgi:uncharacterized membrane protein YraQ (UPF0718 family)
MMFVLLGTFYVAMVAAGFLVEIIFGATNLIPDHRDVMVMEQGITWNYTTWLNIAFLIPSAVLLVRFIRTGGVAMLRMMGGSPEVDHSGHEHHHHGGE